MSQHSSSDPTVSFGPLLSYLVTDSNTTMRIKFCGQKDCDRGGHSPVHYRSEDEDYDSVRHCCACGAKLQQFERIAIGTTAVKRERSEDTTASDRQEATKRVRELPPFIPTGPRNGTPKENPSSIVPRRGGEKDDTFLGVNAGSQNRGMGIPGLGDIGSSSRIVQNSQLPVGGTPGIVSIVQFEDRDLKWCLKCHWNDHSSSECGVQAVQSVQRESLMAQLYWDQYDRDFLNTSLRNRPSDIQQLMDSLTTHQTYLARTEKFFRERDILLRTIVEDGALMRELDPVLYEGETATSVYEAHISMANNATRILVLNVVSAVFQAYRALVLERGTHSQDETMAQFRERMSVEVFNDPARFPVDQMVLTILKSTLESSWKTYVTRMDGLEAAYIKKRHLGRTMDRVQSRFVRLPTSYFRMEVRRNIDGMTLWLPIFQPGRVLSLVQYKSADAEVPYVSSTS